MFLKEFDYSIEMQRMKRKYKDKLMYYGLQGEERVAYQLKKVELYTICMYNIRILFSNEKVQIDFVVITHNVIFIIEVKNLLGNLYISEFNEFERELIKNDVVYKTSMDSPFIQMDYQEKIIKKLLISYNLDREIKSILVMANDKMIIKNNSSRKNVIKYDELSNLIEAINSSCSLDENDFKVANLIMQYDKQYNYNMIKIIKDNIKNQYIPQFKKALDLELYIKILELRKKIAGVINVPVCNIFNNREAEMLVIYKPKTKEEFIRVKGFKEKRYEMFGEDVIKIFKFYS